MGTCTSYTLYKHHMAVCLTTSSTAVILSSQIHTLTNHPERTMDTQVVDGIVGSDHQAVTFDIVCSVPPANLPSLSVYNFKKADFENFRELLSKIPWNCCFLSDDIEESWSNFKDILFSAADRFIPKISICRNRKHKSWLSDDTLAMIK